MMKRIQFLFIAFFLFANGLVAQKFELVKNNTSSTIYYKGNERVINTSIEMLINDSKLVTESPFSQTDKIVDGTIIIGIPDREPAIKDLLSKYKVNFTDLRDKWEAYKIIIVQEDSSSYLFVLGSDARGAAYGVLELSRQIGVTPWVWWADVVPEKKTNISFSPDGKINAPSVQYRGIFLNDEDWALMPWATHTFEPTDSKGAIGPKTYGKIFELLLRLRANTIWPAMHECTIPFFFVDGNREAAEKYGIIVSNSHAEPMMRTNTGEWDSKKYGAFNFLTNEKQVLSYWEERVKELSGSENIYTVGMRGIHDGRMQGVKTLDDETAVLHRVIKEQRDMLLRNNPGKDISEIPQQFVPYKEVLKAYDNGLELPEDVTLVWCDDNNGYIMRLSNEEEKKRSGGAGVYYHVSYWGKPHDYLWLGSTQPGLIYAEMRRAWDNGAQRLWILNVGDIKPNEYLTEFFLDMAWDINNFAGDKIYEHQQQWVKNNFRNLATDEIIHVLKRYYELAAHRKPEHMGWNKVEDWSGKYTGPGLQPVKDSQLSPFVFGDEIERRIEAYRNISKLSKEVYENKIPYELKPAYFQLVHYPVLASDAMSRKILYAQKSRLHASEDINLAAYYADLATSAYNEIAALDYTYNKDMLHGKWELMMDMKPRDLPVFQQPALPELPRDIQISTPVSQTSALVETAGSPVEGDRMIALNAYSYINEITLETIESLGHSGKAVRLPIAKKINNKQPHLEYKIETTSSGKVRIKIGTIPKHPLNNGDIRYALVIDKQEPVIVSTAAAFLSSKWEENALRNQSLTTVDAIIDKAGEHTIRIYALDEEILVDQLMLDFDLEREHYLIPSFK